MSEGINLLDQGKKKTSEAFLRRVNTTRVIMIGLLFIVSVSSVVLFILVSLSPLPALKTQEQSLQQTLARSKNDIIKFELLKERSTEISSILRTRQSLDSILSLIQTKLPKDSHIISLKSDSKNMTLTIESPSLQSLNEFLSSLIGFVQNKQTFSTVTLTNLTTDQSTNAYSATVDLTLLK